MMEKASWTSCKVMASVWALLAQKYPEIRAHNSAYRPTLHPNNRPNVTKTGGNSVT